MVSHDRHTQRLAMCLAGVAGYVDAVGYLQTHGFFVSFMSGNSTRLGVGLATTVVNAAIAAGLIGTFVVGVATGSLTGHAAGSHRRPAVLAVVAALLGLAALLAACGQAVAAIPVMALAMGAENAVFEQGGEIRIGLTYMTGTLVKLGQRLALALRGGDPFGWTAYLMLWLGLVAGAVLGAAAFGRFGLSALSAPAVAAAALAGAAAWHDRRRPR
jgi:uncharacterized membrane protein YoaK (UPF0700 family)